MATNSLAIGMNAALADVALEIARLPDLSPDLLSLIERAMHNVCARDGAVSVSTVLAEIQERLSGDRLEALFFSFVRADALRRVKLNRRGHTFDQYIIEPTRLNKIVHNAAFAKLLLGHLQAEREHSNRTELIATLPDGLNLDPEICLNISSLVARLHRLITDAEKEILVLNPFFEQTGFSRFASALLSAAKRDVIITVITHQLSNLDSVNHQVLSSLAREAAASNLGNQFSFWEFEQTEKPPAVSAPHAKVLLVDEGSAYIGSANLTEYGMAYHLEIGVVVHGPLVNQLKQILRFILESDNTKQVIL